jgi:hypothetical protein
VHGWCRRLWICYAHVLESARAEAGMPSLASGLDGWIGTCAFTCGNACGPFENCWLQISKVVLKVPVMVMARVLVALVSDVVVGPDCHLIIGVLCGTCSHSVMSLIWWWGESEVEWSRAFPIGERAMLVGVMVSSHACCSTGYGFYADLRLSPLAGHRHDESHM